MSGLLLAPYDDSMRLGQGYNSFLHTPCLYNALIPPVVNPATTGDSPQVVTYTSLLATNFKDVIRSMKISSASAIKTGSLKAPGHSTGLDEVKMKESDVTALVSVAVVNQNILSNDEFMFTPPTPGILPQSKPSAKFLDVYGDCYISGFVEGGEFHAVISVKALEESKKDEIRRTLKGNMNNSTANGFSFTDSRRDFGSLQSHAEITITVSWTGGGQIKPVNEEWSLENVFRVAAAFPARVAECPKHTWAILTRYNNNKSFVEWDATQAENLKIDIPQFDNLHRYTADLLHMYMEYKCHLQFLQTVISNPGDYEKCTQPPEISQNAVNEEEAQTEWLALEVDTNSLLKAVKEITEVMEQIVGEVDKLNLDPKATKCAIPSSAHWKAKLPIRKKVIVPAANGKLLDWLQSLSPLPLNPRELTSAVQLVGFSGLRFSAEMLTINCLTQNENEQPDVTFTYLDTVILGPNVQSGHVDSTVDELFAGEQSVSFNPQFSRIPMVAVWLSELTVSKAGRTAVGVEVKPGTSLSSFTVVFVGTTIGNLKATWVAYDPQDKVQLRLMEPRRTNFEMVMVMTSRDPNPFIAINILEGTFVKDPQIKTTTNTESQVMLISYRNGDPLLGAVIISDALASD